MENQVVINPRMLLFAMLSQVKYVKMGEEMFGVVDLLKKKFGKKVDFMYFSENNLNLMISYRPFTTTLENPGVAGCSVTVHPEYEIERDKDLDFFFKYEVLKEEERNFLTKEVVRVIVKYYKDLPGGKERLWEMERRKTPEQVKKLGA